MSNLHSRKIAAVISLFILFSIESLPVFAESATIEEVIVTARKREESAQDVPVAIQAFDTEMIERYGATNLNEIADLATQVSVYPGSSRNGASMVIRGYGSASGTQVSSQVSALTLTASRLTEATLFARLFLT